MSKIWRDCHIPIPPQLRHLYQNESILVILLYINPLFTGVETEELQNLEKDIDLVWNNLSAFLAASPLQVSKQDIILTAILHPSQSRSNPASLMASYPFWFTQVHWVSGDCFLHSAFLIKSCLFYGIISVLVHPSALGEWWLFPAFSIFDYILLVYDIIYVLVLPYGDRFLHSAF